MFTPFRDPATILRDVQAGFGLLTRLPVGLVPLRPDAAWAWPLVGLVVSGLAILAGALALWLGVVPGVAAALVLATQAALTGGLHEDGLADCADGFFGGQDKARRLEIMKDHQIGSYGGLALMLAVLARWSALTVLLAAGHWGAVLAAGAVSRVPMAVLMCALPNARGSGLSASVGAPSAAAAGLACALGLLLAVGLVGGAGLWMVLMVGLVSLGLAQVARAKIGGQTGDVLGAAQVLAEVVALAVA